MKQGAATLISWVLLVGFTIALAGLVTNWAIQNARKFEPETIVAQDVYCSDVAITINSSCSIMNRGVLNIEQLIIVNTTETITKRLVPGLQPRQARKLDDPLGYNIVCSNNTKYIPGIINKNNFIACSTKSFTLLM